MDGGAHWHGQTSAIRFSWRAAAHACPVADSGFAQLHELLCTCKVKSADREAIHLVDSLAELKAVGCAFVRLRDNLDLSTPAGRMMVHVIGAMAEFERELIRERVKAGLAQGSTSA